MMGTELGQRQTWPSLTEEVSCGASTGAASIVESMDKLPREHEAIISRATIASIGTRMRCSFSLGPIPLVFNVPTAVQIARAEVLARRILHCRIDVVSVRVWDAVVVGPVKCIVGQKRKKRCLGERKPRGAR